MEREQLVPVEILSSYFKGGVRVKLPPHMAWFTLDTAEDLMLLRCDVRAAGGELYISDGYRSPAMQAKAHTRYKANFAEWVSKGKVGPAPKYSPAQGGSNHEAGRAIDVDLNALRPIAKRADQVLDVFWPMAAKRGFRPIIKLPQEGVSESWHFDHLTPELELLRRTKGYRAAAAAGIASIIPPY